MSIQNCVSRWAGALALLVCASVCLAVPNGASAEGWGSVTAKFKFKGTPLEPRAFNVGGNCARNAPVDESLIVSKSGGMANVVVYLMPERGQKVPVHPELAKSLSKHVSVDAAKCRFEPHVVVMTKGQTLEIGNKDPIGHNIKADFFANSALGILVPVGGKTPATLDRSESVPVPLTCSIHPFMEGWLVVAETPYAALSDANGDVAIDLVPAGKWTFRLWHEKLGYVKGPSLKRGCITVAIEDGKATDLGTFEFQLGT